MKISRRPTAIRTVCPFSTPAGTGTVTFLRCTYNPHENISQNVDQNLQNHPNVNFNTYILSFTLTFHAWVFIILASTGTISTR